MLLSGTLNKSCDLSLKSSGAVASCTEQECRLHYPFATLLAESFPTASLQSTDNNHQSPECTLNRLAPFHVVVLIRHNYNLVKPSSSLKSASVPTQLNLAGEKLDCTECPPPPYPRWLPPAGPQCCAETTLCPTAQFTGFPGRSSLFRPPH